MLLLLTPAFTPTPSPTPHTIFLDDFETDKGWTVNPDGTDTATTGMWERADPEETTYSGAIYQLGATVSGVYDLVTGGVAGSSVGSYDIDGGLTSIRSPDITLPASGEITLFFQYYLSHYSNATNDDFLQVKVVGSTTRAVFEELGAGDIDGASWQSFSTSLGDFAGQTIYLLIEAADDGSGSLVEAAIDDVSIKAGSGPTPTPSPTPTPTPSPTPTNTPSPTPTNTPTPTPPPGGEIFFDNFESDEGWVANPNGTDTATTGQWERADPEQTTYSGTTYQLGTAASGSYDLVTGPLAGSSAGSYDIDGGVTTIRSPDITLPSGSGIALSFNYYLSHYSNASSDDSLRIKVVGSTTQTVFEELGAGNVDGASWQSFSASLDAFAGQTIYLLIEAADGGSGSLVEAAVDDVSIKLDGGGPEIILEADFDTDTDGFGYSDDTFRDTNQPAYASGERIPSGGFSGGALKVDLGGIDDDTVLNMSGGWQRSFTLSESTEAYLSLRYNLTQASEYESDELSQALVSLDGTLYGQAPYDYIAQIVGDGNGGDPVATGWQHFQVSLGTLAAGDHTLVIGGYNNKKTYNNESTEVLIDDVLVMTQDLNAGARAVVANLDMARFKQNIQALVNFGTRYWSQPGNLQAGDWLEDQLASYGYAVERHTYTYNGQQRDNIYATKVGTKYPDQMYIISAHMDSNNYDSPDRSFAPGADDDASGSALVLEAARVFAASDIQTDYSIRFIFWNNEETGLNGSAEYVEDRASLQGVEDPPGSGQFPEPRWVGVIAADMILYDHGLPPQPDQIPDADINIDYQASSSYASQSLALADALYAGNGNYSTDYPAELGSNMRATDSYSFRNYSAAVSVRENTRDDIGSGSDGSNPHHHRSSDVFESFSEADFRLGFDIVRMTVGTVAELAGTRVTSD